MEKQQKHKFIHWFIIGTFVSLYVLVSLISTIHVIDFFQLSNAKWLAITLAIAFEIGAAASLASIIVLSKMNKWIVWALFFILTAMQAMGNTYYAFTHLENYNGWVELFGLNEEDPLYQKRILSIVSGAILPLVALGFIKSLVDYIKPDYDEVEVEYENKEITKEETVEETVEEVQEVIEEEKPAVEKKPLVDIESFLAALDLAKQQREAVTTEIVEPAPTEPEVEQEQEQEPELITDQPMEFIQVPVVENIEDIQPQYEAEPVAEPQQERYATSYSVDDIKAEEEKKTL
jgi:hypothetical protein